MGNPRFTSTTRLDLFGTSISVADLRAFLDTADDETVISFSYSPGDPRDPREHDSVSLSYTVPRRP